MRHRWLQAVCVVVPMVALPLQAQRVERESGETSLSIGVGGSSVTDVANGNPSNRGGVVANVALSLRLSAFAQLRVEALAAAPSGGDFMDLLAWPFAGDTTGRGIGQQRTTVRGPQSSMIGFAPAIEVEPFTSVPIRIRGGLAWLRSSHVDGTTGSPSNPALIDYVRTTASGLGWRVGLSTPLGKPDSPFVLSADVMRAQSSVGPLYLVPVTLSFRIF